MSARQSILIPISPTNGNSINFRNISEPVRGKPTNNSGEIQAAIEAIKAAKEQGIKRLCINTDSQFVVNSITLWVRGWKRKGWKLADGSKVKNETDFKELDRLYNDESMEIKWVGGAIWFPFFVF